MQTAFAILAAAESTRVYRGLDTFESREDRAKTFMLNSSEIGCYYIVEIGQLGGPCTQLALPHKGTATEPPIRRAPFRRFDSASPRSASHLRSTQPASK